jgi:cell division protein FtsZ
LNDTAQIVLTVAAIVFGGLLAIRLLVVVPGWIRRLRRPESRAIRVIGIGGGGSNAVDRMVAARIPGVGFIACNTDAQALRRSAAETRLRIGDPITRGLGAGGDPGVGRRSAEESAARIATALAGADLVFVTAGLGGGTGSGAAPIIGAEARAQGALTIAVVTKPFTFEGAQRRRVAETALTELAGSVDAIITIPNDRVADVVAEDTSMLEAFRVVDDVLLQVVRGIIDLLSGPGLINLDFADVRAILQDAGPTVIGLGRGGGEDRAVEAARQAIASPLLEARIDGSRGILFNVSGPPDLQLREVRRAAEEIRASADPDANVIFGASLDRPPGEDVLITLIATGPGWPEPAPALAASAGHAGVTPSPADVRRQRKRRVTSDLPPAAEPGSPAEQAPAATDTGEEPATGSAGPMTDGAAPALDPTTPEDVDLDIPSFLRRR